MMADALHPLAQKPYRTITALIFDTNEAAGLIRGDGRITEAERDAAYRALIASADADLGKILADIAGMEIDTFSRNHVKGYARQAAGGFASDEERVRLGITSAFTDL